MKIRSKLLLLEGSITVILFISLLLSFSSLINLSQINSLYKTVLDKSYESKQLRLKIEELLYHPDVTYDDYLDVSDRWNSLTFSSKEISENKILNTMGRDFKKSLENLDGDWLTLTSMYKIENYGEILKQYSTSNNDQYNSFYSYAEDSRDEEVENVLTHFSYFADTIVSLEGIQQTLLDSIRTQMPEIIRSRIVILLIGNIAAVLFCLFTSYYFGHSLMENIRRIRFSINQVSSGEFSHKLQIPSNDEFGRLARDFNAVTEALWAKLESVQSILNDVGDSISNEIEIEKVEKAIVYLGLKSTDASGAGLYLFNEDKTQLVLNYGVGDFRPPYPLGSEGESVLPFKSTDEALASFKDIPIPVGETLIGEAALKGEAVMIKRTYSSAFARPHNHPYHINSVIAIPIRVGNMVYGVLCVIRTGEEYFSDLELANAQSFCELAAISIDSLMKYNEMLEVFELNREIDIAAEIQQNLLPQQIPRLRHTDIAFKTRTCRGINGDFYDCYMLDKDNILITVCEVAGKGVPAALVITMIKTILKLVAKTGLNAAEIMADLNKNITEKIKIENIAALSLLLYNQNTGIISCATAGNQPLLAYREEEDQFEEVLPHGIPVGLDKNADYEERRIKMGRGDVLMLFTDGIPEARSGSGKEYGLNPLKEMCRSHKNESAEDLVSEIIDDLSFFHRDTHQWDDQTIFTLKRGGSAQ
ncbi:MAG: SpoIIE family protein phosphatase [Spirochaetales bacterium]|nr:SpoIIE family protein phosphatase [Spirochaetales bacterium]